MKGLTIPVLIGLLVFAGLGAGAQEQSVNLAGTWKVTHSKTNTPITHAAYTLKLTQAGDTLAGTMSNVSMVNGKSRVYEWPIKEAKIHGGEVSFTVSHPFEVGHGEVTSIYRGNVSGDTINGTVKESFLGHTYIKDWTAERVRE